MRETLIHLYAVFRLLFLEAKAVSYLNTSKPFIKKSLFVPVAMIAFQIFVFSNFIPEAKAPLFTTQVWFAYFFIFTSGVFVYLLFVEKITQLIDRENSFLTYAVAFCWSTPLQTFALVPVFLLRSLDIGSHAVQGFSFSIAVTFVYFLQWGIAKTTLKLNTFSAIGLVILFDLCTSFLPTLAVHLYASGVNITQSLS